MFKNLVEAMDKGDGSRAFSPPVAGDIEGFVPTLFAASHQYTCTPGTTPEGFPSIEVTIAPPSSAGFVDDRDLPHPSIRLNAMAPGQVFFIAADADGGNRLVLQMPFFLLREHDIRAKAPWWGRWVEGECVPFQWVYENVDVVHLETLVRSLIPGVPSFGLTLPLVTEPFDVDAFWSDFSKHGAALDATAGAFLGIAADQPGGAGTKQIVLHGRYTAHETTKDAWPMSPREFLYLLFGADATEVTGNALFIALNDTPQLSGENESNSYRFRPPLRTHDRLMWEASLEQAGHNADWKQSGSLTASSYVDRVVKTDDRGASRTFDFQKTYANENKCSTYVVEICQRAGFRVPVYMSTRGGVTRWQGADTGSIVCALALVLDANAGAPREPVMGAGVDSGRQWAWRIDRLLNELLLAHPVTSNPATSKLSELIVALNALMSDEGRCLLFVHRENEIEGGVISFVGHSMMVIEFIHALGLVRLDSQSRVISDSYIELASPLGRGLKRGSAYMRMAGTTTGATDIGYSQRDGGVVSASLAKLIYLFELHPGGDPGAAQGFEDLNVQIKYADLFDVDL